MNNRKYIIIFGTLILSFVVIIGAITYYKEKAEQDAFSLSQNYPAILNQSLDSLIPDAKQDAFSLSQDFPASFNELSDFISFCKNGVFSDIEELKNKKIKEVVCTIGRELRKLVLKDNTLLVSNYIPSILPLDSITSFKPDCYIGISVDFKDVVREYNPTLLEEEELYFCSISEPSLVDPLILQLESKYDLFFDEGNVSCSGIEMDKTPAMIFLGFVPYKKSLSIKEYLVDEQTVSEVLNKQSFSEMKDILNDYPIIWQMEKLIIP